MSQQQRQSRVTCLAALIQSASHDPDCYPAAVAEAAKIIEETMDYLPGT